MKFLFLCALTVGLTTMPDSSTAADALAVSVPTASAIARSPQFKDGAFRNVAPMSK